MSNNSTPICTKRNPSGARIEIYPQCGRIVAPDGGILIEFAAAHVRRKIDAARWPGVLPPDLPANAIAIDRYGDYKPGRNTPHGVTNPELIAAINAMQPVNVEHMQNDDSGCGAAVVAVMRGISYAQAVEELYNGRGVRPLSTTRLAAATNTTRHICMRKTWEEVEEGEAVAALIKSTDPRLGRHYGHFVAIDTGNMVIIDPELVLHYPLAEYPRRAWTPLMYFSRS